MRPSEFAVIIQVHELTLLGTKGKLEKIGGVECYVATPSVDYPKDKVLLYLSDVFGVSLVNSQVLCQPLFLSK